MQHITHHCETTKRLHIDILELVDTSPFLAYNSTPIKGPTERHCFLAVGLLWASVQAQPWSTRMVKPTHFGWNSGTCCSSCGSLGGGRWIRQGVQLETMPSPPDSPAESGNPSSSSQLRSFTSGCTWIHRRPSEHQRHPRQHSRPDRFP